MTIDELREAFHALPGDSAAGRELRRFQARSAPITPGWCERMARQEPPDTDCAAGILARNGEEA